MQIVHWEIWGTAGRMKSRLCGHFTREHAEERWEGAGGGEDPGGEAGVEAGGAGEVIDPQSPGVELALGAWVGG